MSVKKIAQFGMLVALAFIFSYVEAMVPLPIPIPGIKLGLANLVVVVALYCLGIKEALIISIIRVILVGFTFGSLSSMIYSLVGGLLSFAIMALCKKLKIFSVTGVSMAGGVFHNLGQLIVAIYVVETSTLIYYFPFLLVAGVVTGALIGIIGKLMIDRIFINL
ncbi:Heptaprenyl diphosphate synthase component I [Lachnospiraceae bacterium TWA4]|nr:Heptaprenyl diphosphate synthase component I [Lachnospiraceae bacterium TWA4]